MFKIVHTIFCLPVYRDGESKALNVSRLDKGKAGQDVSEHGCEAWTRKNWEDPTSKVGGRILLTRAEDVESEYQRNKLGHFRGDVVAIQKEFLGAQIWPPNLHLSTQNAPQLSSESDVNLGF